LHTYSLFVPVKGEEVGEEDFVDKIMKRLQGSSKPQLDSSDDVGKEVEFETATLFQKVRDSFSLPSFA
jgi:hypothetical protein